MVDKLAIEAADVFAAAEIIRGVAVRTPLLEYPRLNERVGRRVLIKFEGAQHTGSFKFRGAFHRLSCLSDVERISGVVAYSSGNHGQAIAAAARLLGIVATIVMPTDAPCIKLESTRSLGAEVVLYDRTKESREEIATILASERGAILVPSFDDPMVMAGQGTIGLEIIEQAYEMGANISQALAPCGGGGLIAGVATAIKCLKRDVEIYSVEPAGFDETARSLASRKREIVAADATSICDAILAPTPGQLTFPINVSLLSGGLVVTDDQVCDTIRYAFETLKLVIEPGGAVALAAALHSIAPPTGGDTAIVISGSNIDPAMYASIITAPETERVRRPSLKPDGERCPMSVPTS